MNPDQIDKHLDQTCLTQLAWKSPKMLATCLLITEHALKKPVFYPDELTFDILLTEEDRNCIGSCFRMVAKTLKLIEKTGAYRRSTKDGQNGRVIWEYKLINRPLAEAFLRRYDAEKYKALAHPKLNLGL